MRCRRIQELLRTDYLDAELGSNERDYIRKHLSNCGECRRLERELLAQRLVFQKAKPAQPPERLWQNIQNAIVREELNKQRSVQPGIIQRQLAWRGMFTLASALTALIFILVFAGNLIQKRQVASNENGSEAISDYSLNTGSDDLSFDLGTNIEEFFL